MTVETEFRAALLAHAPLLAVVENRVALSALPEGFGYPGVIYTVAHNRTHAVDGTLVTDQCAITVECWDDTGVAASTLADLVTAALDITTYPALLAHGVQVLERSTAADPEAGLDAIVLTVDWWA